MMVKTAKHDYAKWMCILITATLTVAQTVFKLEPSSLRTPICGFYVPILSFRDFHYFS